MRRRPPAPAPGRRAPVALRRSVPDRGSGGPRPPPPVSARGRRGTPGGAVSGTSPVRPRRSGMPEAPVRPPAHSRAGAVSDRAPGQGHGQRVGQAGVGHGQHRPGASPGRCTQFPLAPRPDAGDAPRAAGLGEPLARAGGRVGRQQHQPGGAPPHRCLRGSTPRGQRVRPVREPQHGDPPRGRGAVSRRPLPAQAAPGTVRLVVVEGGQLAARGLLGRPRAFRGRRRHGFRRPPARLAGGPCVAGRLAQPSAGCGGPSGRQAAGSRSLVRAAASRRLRR